MKGILLAGGTGSRLAPMTKYISKHLLPVYDKPMIYYSLSTLMLSGIRDITIIGTTHDLPLYKMLFEDGKRLGININYIEQNIPRGIAEAFLLAERYIERESVALMLGDNFFYGQSFSDMLNIAKTESCKNAVVFAYPVKSPSGYGVIEFNNERIISIEEKPKKPKSNFAIPGLYFFDNTVVDKARILKPSHRGELEITDINRMYLDEGKLKVLELGRGMTWFDMGTPETMLKTAEFVNTIQHEQGFYVSSPEEIAWRMRFISDEELEENAMHYSNSAYGEYLLSLI